MVPYDCTSHHALTFTDDSCVRVAKGSGPLGNLGSRAARRWAAHHITPLGKEIGNTLQTASTISQVPMDALPYCPADEISKPVRSFVFGPQCLKHTPAKSNQISVAGLATLETPIALSLQVSDHRNRRFAQPKHCPWTVLLLKTLLVSTSMGLKTTKHCGIVSLPSNCAAADDLRSQVPRSSRRTLPHEVRPVGQRPRAHVKLFEPPCKTFATTLVIRRASKA